MKRKLKNSPKNVYGEVQEVEFGNRNVEDLSPDYSSIHPLGYNFVGGTQVWSFSTERTAG
jgi:hypothetical protein